MQNENEHYLFQLKELGDDRGGLIVVNAEAEIPFAIRRVFYNYHTVNAAIRANHANLNSSFVMISVSGSCAVEVDEGNKSTEYLLDSPDKALYVGKCLWKIMKDFSHDNILLIFSDHEYDKNEYISDYEEYLSIREKLYRSK